MARQRCTQTKPEEEIDQVMSALENRRWVDERAFIPDFLNSLRERSSLRDHCLAGALVPGIDVDGESRENLELSRHYTLDWLKIGGPSFDRLTSEHLAIFVHRSEYEEIITRLTICLGLTNEIWTDAFCLLTQSNVETLISIHPFCVNIYKRSCDDRSHFGALAELRVFAELLCSGEQSYHCLRRALDVPKSVVSVKEFFWKGLVSSFVQSPRSSEADVSSVERVSVEQRLNMINFLNRCGFAVTTLPYPKEARREDAFGAKNYDKYSYEQFPSSLEKDLVGMMTSRAHELRDRIKLLIDEKRKKEEAERQQKVFLFKCVREGKLQEYLRVVLEGQKPKS